MKQIATVTRMIKPDLVEVTVARQTACSHDCEKCGGCGSGGGSISVSARTEIPLVPGDKVELYSDNRVLGYAALVYLLPVVLFLVGYFILPLQTEGVRYLCAGTGFGVGIVAAIACDRYVRRNNAVTYQIIRKL